MQSSGALTVRLWKTGSSGRIRLSLPNPERLGRGLPGQRIAVDGKGLLALMPPHERATAADLPGRKTTASRVRLPKSSQKLCSLTHNSLRIFSFPSLFFSLQSICERYQKLRDQPRSSIM